MLLVSVLIEYSSRSLDRPFLYYSDLNRKIDVGFRVLIPFNTQEIIGYVISVEETDKSLDEIQKSVNFDIQKVIEVIDETPILNDDLLSLADFMKDYYQSNKISILQTMLPPSLKPRKSSLNAPKIAYDKYLVCIDEDEEDLTDKQKEILRLIIKEKKILKRELLKHVSIVDKLIELNRVQIVYEEKQRFLAPSYDSEVKKQLTPLQEKVVEEFLTSDDEVYLLQGVTGSGKTEVYLHLAESIIKEGKSVLMLVPEISLTPMMMEMFIRRFSKKVAILHSQLTPAEKYDEYRKIARGDAEVVVGVRSAIFAPLKNIGLIILDEEHVESYKQDVPPFYHAREVAIQRGKMHHAKVLLASATPSLESRARAQNNVYHLLTLKERINCRELPKTTIVNLLDYHNIDKNSHIFSLTLRKELERVLNNREQAILLINRRGFAQSVTCRKCGYVFHCHDCHIALTYHKEDNMLKCHHCDHVEVYPDRCPECGSTYLFKIGFGTERIEEEIHRLFPNARTLRLDSDSSKVRSKIPSIINDFRLQKADILIGTQMIAKGHDFPNVTLVGIVLADIGLNLPNFRSSERTFQLITQAIGRSGRDIKSGTAIIQTYNPSHYAITAAARQDYDLFYQKEMSIRKIQAYPPYTYLVGITIKSSNEDNLINNAYFIIDYLKEKLPSSVILGPSTPYISYQGEKYIRSILIKYKDQDETKSVLAKLIELYVNKSNVTLEINIDPYNF